MCLDQCSCLKWKWPVSCGCQRKNSHLSNTIPKSHPKAEYFIISLTSLPSVTICLCQFFTQDRKKLDMTVTYLTFDISDLCCTLDKYYSVCTLCQEVSEELQIHCVPLMELITAHTVNLVYPGSSRLTLYALKADESVCRGCIQNLYCTARNPRQMQQILSGRFFKT